jgi:hypothetical protein
LRKSVRDHAFLWQDDPAPASGGALGGLPS